MARTQASPGLDVYQIFNLCQRTVSAHQKCIGLLWQLEMADSELCLQSFLTCIKHMLLIPPGSQSAGRIIGFIAGFVAARDPSREAECDAFAEKLLRWLISLVTVKDRTVRFRCCQLVAVVFRSMSADEADGELLDELEQTMLLRLDDKVPAVRACAVTTLPRFCDPGDAGEYANDRVLKAFLQLLAADRSKDVRKAVLSALPGCDRMVEELINRTCDVNHEVRKLAYVVLRDKVAVTYLSVHQRVELLRRGLGERAPSVQKEAIIMMQVWLEDKEACNWDPVKLLQLLDVQKNEEVAALGLKMLIQVRLDKSVRRPRHEPTNSESFAINPRALALSAAKGSRGLRQAPDAGLLSPEEALLWKAVCIHLHKSGQEKGGAAAALTGAPATTTAASAEDHLEALEAALPPTTSQFMQLLAAHAAAGQLHSFATCQLLQLAATCMDMADAAGRQATTDLAHQLLRDSSRFEGSKGRAGWESALLQLTRHVYASHAELADAMLCMLWDMFDSWGLAEKSQDACGEQDNSMTGDESAFQSVLEQASQVRNRNQQWAHTLRTAGLLLQQLPSAQLHTTGKGLFQCIEDLWPHLIMPGLSHAVAAVRLEAMQTLGLYCLLEGIPRPDGQVAALRAGLVWQRPQTGTGDDEAEEDEAAIRVVAAKALCDWALIKGPKASDQWYLNQAPVAHDLQVSPPSSPQQKEELKPLLDLLLSTLHSTLQSDRQDMSQSSEQPGASDEEEELAGVLAEGIAKVLLHAHIWSAETGKGLQEAEVARALAVLLVAQFNPATHSRPWLRQCLSVFFPAYAAASSSHQHHLARAFRRAARGALGTAPPKKAPAPQVMRYMLQLLQMVPKEEEREKEHPPAHAGTRLSYPGLAEELVREVTQCSRCKDSKAYLMATLKVLLALPLDPTPDPAAIKRLRALVGQVSRSVKDRAAAKDLGAYAKQLEALDATPQQGLDADALSELMQSVSLHTQTSAEPSESDASAQAAPQEGTPAQRSSGEGTSSQAGPSEGRGMAGEDLLADCPLPFEERGPGAVADTPAKARNPANRGPITDDTSDTESRVKVPSTAIRRQMPARSARTTKKLVDIVTSSESERTTSDDSSTDAEEDP